MIRPIRVFFSSSQVASSMPAEISSMKPRYAGKFSPYSENNGKSSDAGTRYGIGSMPQAICTPRPMMNTRPKVNSNSAMWPLWWTRRSPHTSIAAPIAPHSKGAITSAGQKPTHWLDLVGEVGAEHVDAGMSEVQHTHHAEDQRQPAGQHEQQHAVNEAIQQRNQADLHQGSRSAGHAGFAPNPPEALPLGLRQGRGP